MNQEFLYEIDSTVWTIQDGTNLVENWVVQQVNILVTTETVVTYVLRRNNTCTLFLEEDVYASLSDALATLT